MARGITPDGLYPANRVEQSTYRKIAAKVVDQILTPATYYARLVGRGKRFEGIPQDYTVKITHDDSGEWYSGMPTFSSAAADTRITLSYTPTAFEQPVVLPMLESFQNAVNPAFDLDQSKIEEAVDDAIHTLGTSVYGLGTGDQILGLQALVDDGTSVTTIGGQSRSTYSALAATRTASGGTVSLSKMATLHDAVSQAGMVEHEPNIGVTTKAVWSNIEELYSPNVRGSYKEIGYDMLPVRGDIPVRRAELKGGAGFTAITWRGMPIIKDEHCTAQTLYFLNERYIDYRGLTVVPKNYKVFVEPVNLGEPKVMDGVRISPSKFHGWFFQKFQMSSDQPGIVARYHVMGQAMSSQPRTSGRLTAITGV